MKRFIKIICATFLLVLLVGCSNNNNIENISYSELSKLIENKESFILEIVQDGCTHCEAFTPKFNDVLVENNITAKSINLTKLSEEDINSLKGMFSYNGTPNVIFITDGKEQPIYRRMVGSDFTREQITNKIKKAGFIK